MKDEAMRELETETRDRETTTELLHTRGIKKIYGPTVANNDVEIFIHRGEVVGLIGANGAGKSTLMRVLAGVTDPDEGTMTVSDTDIVWRTYNPTQASRMGIRVVYQELSLCTNLTVYENFYVEQAQRFKGVRKWRSLAKRIARENLDAIFPGNSIDINTRLSNLTIAQQQMVEIARAVSDLNLKILILDEPTSSLGAEQTNQLIDYIKRRQKDGISFIFISHRLTEVITLADRIFVMQNGMMRWNGTVGETDENDLVGKMSEGAGDEKSPRTGQEPTRAVSPEERSGTKEAGGPVIEIEDLSTDELDSINLSVGGGEILGIAGLEGSGQRELLRTIFKPDSAASHAIKRSGNIAYVTGDRKKEGIFGLWSIAKNIAMTKIAQYRMVRPIKSDEGKRGIDEWYERLKIVSDGTSAPITSLSGGNQQKVLIARAMMADADIILLDDPTRGVDIGTKKQLYELFREAARSGKMIIWYSTEDEELTICDRVVVLRYGRIMRELDHTEATKENIINASFSGEKRAKKKEEDVQQDLTALKKVQYSLSGIAIPLGAMLLIYILSGILTPSVFSRFGVELLIGGSIPLVLATLAQMYVIGLSMVDLGIGAYMGLVNVLSATLLRTNPLLGTLSLLIGLGFYALMGFLIYSRQIPAIVVTLGASFVWTGVAYSIQNIPGGAAPEWLVKAYNVNIPIIPEVVLIVIAAGVLAYVVYRSKYGTVLRGFGNNPMSMQRSGWSPAIAFSMGFLIAGVFGLMGGLSVTAITTASDANATLSYTLLTVAAVVMGGGELTGGIVSPVGAIFGAITLSLIGSLLGFLNLSSNYVAAVQGGILILVLALRLLRRGK
jgi:ribose transport system ATP-binding protein